jgi:nucleotide-binding universal stress UspA family protein
MFHTIVVATDGSDHADKAVAVAGDLAAKYDAEITLLHVFLRRNAEATDLRRLIDVQMLPVKLQEEFERFEGLQEQRKISASTVVGPSIPFPEDVMVGVGNAIVDKAKDIAKQHGAIKINRVITNGDPADIILNTAKDRHADLIVMGTRGLSDLKGLFVGSVSHKVSHLADCTCITVR